MSLLSKLLQKRGIEKEADLSKDEKEVFDRYKKVLNGELLTVDTIKQFCQSQIKLIESKCANGIERPTDIQLACLHVYLNVLKTIEAPEAERESLERYLTQLIG